MFANLSIQSFYELLGNFIVGFLSEAIIPNNLFISGMQQFNNNSTTIQHVVFIQTSQLYGDSIKHISYTECLLLLICIMLPYICVASLQKGPHVAIYQSRENRS